MSRPNALMRVALAIALSATIASAGAVERLRLATTTSTESSGLLAAIHPHFERALDAKVDVIAVGSGAALELGRNGDVDVVLAHDPAAEEVFVASGAGIDRRAVMYNDFVIVGPPSDPARVAESGSAARAFAAIVRHQQPFVSRGDQSGTHVKELALWRAAGIAPAGDWYLAAGQGMGPVLQMASDKLGYTLTDRGTWVAFRDDLALALLHAGGGELHNPYHVMLVNPARHPHVNNALARAYVEFLTGRRGQALIAAFRVAGEQLFVPAAAP